MTAAMSPASLSHGDELIVNSVFDPENSPETPTVKINPQLPQDPKIQDLALLKTLRSTELEAVRLVEQYSINTTRPSFSSPTTNVNSPGSFDELERQEVYKKALAVLSSLIEEHPDYASAYNNRAQLRRWRYGEKLLSPSKLDGEAQDALDLVIKDLETSTQLASPAGTSAAVSPNQARLLSQAWTQRGAIFWGLAKKSNPNTLPRKQDDIYSERHILQDQPENWRSWDSTRLEEEGSKSFFMAGMYGSEIGRTMAVKTNPYARLCAGIVKEAMRSEYGV